MATIASPGTRQENLNQQAPVYNVVLLDDAEHTYDYVVEMLEKLFALSDRGRLEARRGGGQHGPHHRDHLRVAGCRVRARSDPRLRSGLADAEQQGIDVGDRGTLPAKLTATVSKLS